ncbi:hypothetical protein Tco_0446520, partial [Tanacetum coccineum]
EERLAREKVEKEQEANIALIETWDDIQEKIDVASSTAASVKLIDFTNSKAVFGSGTMLSSAVIVTFFLTTLLLAVHFLAGAGSDSSYTSTVASVVSAVFFPYEPLPLIF